MTDQKPWFLVMRPEDANRAGSQWLRVGATSRLPPSGASP